MSSLHVVLLVLWAAFSPIIGISIGQFLEWCGDE
jgi:hypothetical protein